jgi:hypothetical protein
MTPDAQDFVRVQQSFPQKATTNPIWVGVKYGAKQF